jgi:hypothetical protein
MKLSSEKLGSVLEQIDAEVVPDDHPSLPTRPTPADWRVGQDRTLGRCQSAASGGSYTRTNGYSDQT